LSTSILTNPTIIAAIVAGAVSSLGVLAAVVAARWQLNAKLEEIELKTKELDLAAERLERELDALRQAQLGQILAKRLDAYPRLWSVLLTYGLNWAIERKPRNEAWARKYLSELNQCNAQCGLFFSQSVYVAFHRLRAHLVEIDFKLSKGELLDEAEFTRLDTIVSGVDGAPGLATYLKDDLGSYRPLMLQRRPGATTD
jgi:outer membrane murein-binding lipoprotein Lpp